MQEKNVHLEPVILSQSNSAVSYFSPPTDAEFHHFETKNGKIWMDIVYPVEGKELFSSWQNSANKIGLKNEISNDYDGKVFLRVQTQQNSFMGSLFYTGRNLINLGISLPFPVPNNYNELQQEQQATVLEKFDTLKLMLEAVAYHFVLPSEFIFYPDFDHNLSKEQRLYGFIQFWTEVKYNFAFFDQVPELDWDGVLAEYLPVFEKEQSTDEYYQNLSKLCALLKDGHTNIYPPSHISRLYDQPALSLIMLENQPVVSNVDSSLVDMLPIGSQILQVDGMEVDSYMQKHLFPTISSSTDYILRETGIRELLKGKRDSQVSIVYSKPDGRQEELTLKRNSRGRTIQWAKKQEDWKLLDYRKLPNHVAYVALNSFGNDKIVEEFEKYLDSINSAKGLIIDLRKNGGGNSGNAYKIIHHLTDQPYVTSRWQTREHRAAYKAYGKYHAQDHRQANRNSGREMSDDLIKMLEYYEGNRWYKEEADTITPPANQKAIMPTIILMGHHTASAAEDFLIAVSTIPHIKTVGQRSYGSTGMPLMMDLPGGGSARICTKKDTYPDGKEFVGFGIAPHVEAENTLVDLLEGTDSTLELAIDLLNKSSVKRGE